jgi:HEAT repeat protein
MVRPFAFGSAIALVVIAAFGQGTARGGPKTPAAPAAAPTPALSPGVAQKLKSNDPEQIKVALDEARLAGKGAAPVVLLVVELLERGLPYALTQAALDTLGDAEVESSSPVVAWYATHRSPPVRRAAVKALIHTKGAIAAKTLRTALSDADPGVRGVAATGLGALKAKDAVGELFVALDHRVNEAAASIGQLCNPTECDALASRIGRLPFDVVTSGLDPVLFRPVSEVSDDAKVKLVGRIRELGTQEANKYLRDVQKRWPTSGSQRTRQSIDQAVLATAAAPGGSSVGGQ